MVSRVQKKIALRQKLEILRAITGSKSVKKSSIIQDAFSYINQLKLKVQAMRIEYRKLMKQIQAPPEVKVEKHGNGILIRLTCEKRQDLLVSILSAFEEMGLNVLQARVSCNHCFFMETIAIPQDKALDVRNVTQALVKAIAKPDGEEHAQV